MTADYDKWLTTEEEPCSYCNILGHCAANCTERIIEEAERLADEKRDEQGEQ